MSEEFYTMEDLNKAVNLLTYFGIQDPEAVFEFSAEDGQDEFWTLQVKQRFYHTDRLLEASTNVFGNDYDGESAQLDLIATVLGFELGATQLFVGRKKATFIYPEFLGEDLYNGGAGVTKYCINEIDRRTRMKTLRRDGNSD